MQIKNFRTCLVKRFGDTYNDPTEGQLVTFLKKADEGFQTWAFLFDENKWFVGFLSVGGGPMFLVSFGNMDTGELLKLKTENKEEEVAVENFVVERYYASKEKVLELWLLLQQGQFDKLKQEDWLPMNEWLGLRIRKVSGIGWNKLKNYQRRLKAT